MQQTIQVGNRTIGSGEPLFLIAECGITCNYDMDITRDLIHVVRDAGADAIKLMFNFPKEVMSDSTVEYTYDTVRGQEKVNMFEMFEKLQFSLEQWHKVKETADDAGVILFATVSNFKALNCARELDLDAIKLSSWDYNYPALWSAIAALGKPMFLDTGPVSTVELSKSLQIMAEAGNEKSVLIHCYHTKSPSEMNMRSIPYMAQAFNSLVGFSASGREWEPDVTAVSLGSVALEKRLTMDRNLPGHHHILSMEPQEFIDWAKMIRDVHKSLGVMDMIPSAGDLADRKKYFRHLVANANLEAGTVITPEMITAKRPEAGLSPEYMDVFIGRTLKQSMKENDSFDWDTIL